MDADEISQLTKKTENMVEDAEDALEAADREYQEAHARLCDAERCRNNARTTLREQRRQLEVLRLARIGLEHDNN
jgi:hypothetical protein